MSPYNTSCDGCGGGIDADHPTTCTACRFERITGRSYDDTVIEASRARTDIGAALRRAVQAYRSGRPWWRAVA